jgi:hypothetical protein
MHAILRGMNMAANNQTSTQTTVTPATHQQQRIAAVAVVVGVAAIGVSDLHCLFVLPHLPVSTRLSEAVSCCLLLEVDLVAHVLADTCSGL